MIDTCGDEAALADESCIRMVAAFDHEEIGSQSAPGAKGTLLPDALRRLTAALAKGSSSAAGGNSDTLARSMQSSLLISADMAHAVHPNYSGKHECNHAPKFHKGMVIKTNANQRYATTAVTALMFKQFAVKAGVPVQEFVVRQDCGCGSTIGPVYAYAPSFFLARACLLPPHSSRVWRDDYRTNPSSL